ncbi:MAG: adenylate/guanylate cyclase domain-containing protein [bacterium]|nr:adenylate/guanylate cyclase domain-containing protein [bacterium]
MKDLRKKAMQAVVMAMGATVLIGVLWLTGVLDRWENTTWDWRVRTLAAEGANDNSLSESPLCLILLDQPSLDWGQETNGWSWPWPREVYTTIIDFCVRGEARSLSFDVLYTEPSVYGVWDDQAFGESISSSEFFVGAAFVHTAENAENKITLPISEVKDNCLKLANVSDVPDGDGIFRRATLWMETEQEARFMSLGSAASLVADESGTARAILDAGPAQRILHFRDPEKFWPIYSAAAVIQSDLRLMEGAEPSLDPSVVKGKHVLFGMSAPGLKDLRPTPLNRVSPGVTVHATALENILNDDFIAETPLSWVLLVMFVFSFAAAFVLLTGGKLWRTILAIIVFLSLPLLIGLLAVRGGMWWPVVPGTLSHAAALAGAMILAWATEGRQKRFIRQAFRHYLSPDVIQRIMDDPDRLKLGGERREMTIFFSDLEGFTTLSEGLEPNELTQLLNEYLTDMTDIILASGGTLDKYEGDAIIAFWNAPVDQSDHALRACRASVDCQRKLTARRAEFEERFGATLHMRIGLNSGPVIVGNMGSSQRFDYTVLGDAANLAARLEGANKVFGTYLMISDSTREAVNDEMMFRELGDLRVVGRKQPVRVHELEGYAGELEPEHWNDYRLALDKCKEGQLEEAKQAMARLKNDPAAGKWLERLAQEDDGFDAIWNLSRK